MLWFLSFPIFLSVNYNTNQAYNLNNFTEAQNIYVPNTERKYRVFWWYNFTSYDFFDHKNPIFTAFYNAA